MDRILEMMSLRFGLPAETILLTVFGLGVLLVFFAVSSVLSRRHPAAVRIANLRAQRLDARKDRGLLRETVATPKGLFKAALPSRQSERRKIEDKLIQAGLSNPNALRIYTLTRVWLGVLIPMIVALLIVAAKTPGIPFPSSIASFFESISNANAIQLVGLLTGVGYFLPAIWLNRRRKERQQKIRDAFPNALDLLQISLQAGIGFDAAMTRVGNELAAASPDLAFEFLSTQHEIQAGRPRGDALSEMARRTGVDEIRSFATVVQQSMRFGTSMSDALTTYASEMRDWRENRAQELANQLPVKMSAVLAALMLPTLMIITAAPSLIRYFRGFGA
ncbi:type II secretion system F family protein [Ruegeria arenilitoris]|uniref:type II secretion system F family protein n=1 Tax=Ruegeria arenilitoris TaxID=1173585 RepID=UPI00147D2FE8|nr:type II secretion system F family protein [Ruegeria arenilitoris]